MRRISLQSQMMTLPNKRDGLRSKKGKTSFDCLSAGLELCDIARFLLETLTSFTTDEELKTIAVREYDTLIAKVGTKNYVDCEDELANCNTTISAFLTNSSNLPSAVVFEAHSLTGCILELLKKPKLASQSFVKALWMASATDELPSELLALTLHRLGRANGAMGNAGESRRLLRQALQQYAAAGISREHEVAVEARALLAVSENMCASASRLYWASFSNLDRIPEEPEAERRSSL